ncbi:MAG: hypothetical protein LUQ07_07160, partial [Methanospirillum sp.]|nr:hypothetical protein [Methanospirillum sp.]
EAGEAFVKGGAEIQGADEEVAAPADADLPQNLTEIPEVTGENTTPVDANVSQNQTGTAPGIPVTETRD